MFGETMQLFKLICALALCTVVTACATPAPTSLAFGNDSSTALLVAASAPTSMATSVELRRVNMQTMLFEDEVVTIINAGIGGDQIERNSNIWLSMQEIQGGDYALVSVSTNTFNGYAGGSAWRCFYSGAPVFKLPAGQISILPLHIYWAGAPGESGYGRRSLVSNPNDIALIREFENIRPRYASISGAPIVVTPNSMIRWEERRGVSWNRNCSEPPSFSIIVR